MSLQPAKRYEWERIVRRCILGRQTKLVALVLATYASPDGSNVRPGVERLAAVCDMGESTVRRHVTALLAAGLIERVGNGGGPRKLAAVYRLTVPEDLLETVPMLDPDERTPLATVSAVRPVDNHGTPLTQQSGVTPVDNSNSAHSGERCSDENSAHFGTELRSLSRGTPLTLAPNSAHPGERPPTDQGDQTTNHQHTITDMATSPDDAYRIAAEKLARLPDLGTGLIAQAPDGTSLRDAVVWAAGQIRTA